MLHYIQSSSPTLCIVSVGLMLRQHLHKAGKSSRRPHIKTLDWSQHSSRVHLTAKAVMQELLRLEGKLQLLH